MISSPGPSARVVVNQDIAHSSDEEDDDKEEEYEAGDAYFLEDWPDDTDVRRLLSWS